MRVSKFFKFNKFKIIFLLAFIVITGLVFWLADFLDSNIFAIIFAILYFPALFFAWNFQFLPIFKFCSGDICSYHQTIPVRISVLVFIVYVYLLACLIDLIIHKLRKR